MGFNDILNQSRRFLEFTYTDTFTLFENTLIQNPDNPATKTPKLVPVQGMVNIPCRVSFVEQLLRTDSPENSHAEINPIGASIKIFTAPEHQIEKGMVIVASKRDGVGNVYATYSGLTALPNINVSFQEVVIKQEGEA